MKCNKIIIIGLCILMMAESVLAAYPSGWNKCKNFTINNPTGSNVTDFVVPFNVSFDADMQADMDDLRFYSGGCAGTGSILFAELESKTDSTNAYIFVKTNLSTGNNTVSMYYGNSTVSNSWNLDGNMTDTLTTGLYHLNNTLDSSSKQYDGSDVGSVYNDSCAWGGCRYFANSDDSVTISNPFYFLNDTNFTVSAWVKHTGYGASDIIFDWDDTVGSPKGGFSIGTGTTGNMLAAIVNLSGSVDEEVSASGKIVNNTWVYLTYVFYSNHSLTYPLVYYYLNGAYIENDNFDATSQKYIGAPDSTTNAYIGASEGTNGDFLGYIDEISISNTVRSNDWINMSYQLVANHASFVTYGIEEIPPASDTCTYSGSGDWFIKASDNCNITSNVDVHGDIHINETGNLNIAAMINLDDSKRISIGSGIRIAIMSGGGIR